MGVVQERYPVPRSWLRIGLALLAPTPLSTGLCPVPAPRVLRRLPAPRQIPYSALGPYNEHLVRDYGALNLALGVLLVFAGVSLEGGLVRASLAAWLVYATPHFVFHLTQGHAFAPVDNVAQLGTLGFLVLLPLALLVLVCTHGEQRKGAGRT